MDPYLLSRHFGLAMLTREQIAIILSGTNANERQNR